MFLRLTGAVESFEDRPWRSRDGSRSGSIPTVAVRLNAFLSTEVTLGKGMDSPAEGEVVDYIVEVTAQGGYTRARATGHWPKDEDLALAGSASWSAKSV